MKRAVEKRGKSRVPENNEGSGNTREHLELLRSSRYFKHSIRKEKFVSASKLDMLLTKIYLAL